jgi:hypothetical protein
MALTNGQKKALHSAARQAGLSEIERRMLQKSRGGFESAAAEGWTRQGFIRVMAALETLCQGQVRGCSPGYWRDQERQATPGDGLRWRITQLAGELGFSSDQLDAFLSSRHMSGGKFLHLADAPVYWLTRLLDALKAIQSRRKAGVPGEPREGVASPQAAACDPTKAEGVPPLPVNPKCEEIPF